MKKIIVWQKRTWILAGLYVTMFLLCAFCAFPFLSTAVEEEQTEERKETQQTAEYPYLPLNAKGAVLIDGDSGRILYAKDADLVMPMASTTKIMTCIVTVEYGKLEEWVTFSSYAASQPKVHLGAKAGKQFLLKDLLYSLMLESHNDTAVAIAEHIGGKILSEEGKVKEGEVPESKLAVERFVDLMNEKATQLGLDNTFFVTPNGLDGNKEVEIHGEKVLKKHSTTALELALMMRYCVYESPQKETFLSITRQADYSFWDKERKVCYSCNNHNNLLNQMPQALSGKTGFTNAAGYCYVAALQEGEEKYCLALLACGWPNNKNYKWADSKHLFAYGAENYEHKTFEVVPTLQEILVKNGANEDGDPYAVAKVLPEITQGEHLDRSYAMLVREGEDILVRVNQQLSLEAPVQKGTLVGEVEYYLKENGGRENVLDIIPLFVGKDIPEIDFIFVLEYIVDKYLLMGKK